MITTAIAVDDDPSALKILQNYAKKTSTLSLLDCFTQPLEALEYLDQQAVDMVFVDIEMDELSGIEFIKIVKSKQLDSAPKFVITSAHDDYALQGYDLAVTDYLLKPAAYQRFLQSIEKVRKEKRNAQADSLEKELTVLRDYLFLRNNGKLIKLRHQDILYVQSDGHFVKVHLKEQSYPLMLSYKITQMEELLPASSFVRTHKRYIINLEHLAEMDSSTVCLEHVEPMIPVGGTYRRKINQLCKALSA